VGPPKKNSKGNEKLFCTVQWPTKMHGTGIKIKQRKVSQMSTEDCR